MHQDLSPIALRPKKCVITSVYIEGVWTKFFFFSCVLGRWEKTKIEQRRTKGVERICVLTLYQGVLIFSSFKKTKSGQPKTNLTNFDLLPKRPAWQIYSSGKSSYTYAKTLSTSFRSLFCSVPLFMFSFIFQLLFFFLFFSNTQLKKFSLLPQYIYY